MRFIVEREFDNYRKWAGRLPAGVGIEVLLCNVENKMARACKIGRVAERSVMEISLVDYIRGNLPSNLKIIQKFKGV